MAKFHPCIWAIYNVAINRYITCSGKVCQVTRLVTLFHWDQYGEHHKTVDSYIYVISWNAFYHLHDNKMFLWHFKKNSSRTQKRVFRGTFARFSNYIMVTRFAVSFLWRRIPAQDLRLIYPTNIGYWLLDADYCVWYIELGVVCYNCYKCCICDRIPVGYWMLNAGC